MRWLGGENEENVARTRNCCGWPSFPLSMLVPLMYSQGQNLKSKMR